MDRRTTIKWMFAAAAVTPSLGSLAAAPEAFARDVAANQAGYGTDPDLVKEPVAAKYRGKLGRRRALDRRRALRPHHPGR